MFEIQKEQGIFAVYLKTPTGKILAHTLNATHRHAVHNIKAILRVLKVKSRVKVKDYADFGKVFHIENDQIKYPDALQITK